ncbi:MAG TPA: hypothetical protein DIW07_16315 [Lachnospiraceae bacterium]|jgi:hypothetical protein|nr:hypothetical protein [Lachnospiraceae bacterium]HCR84935.1 hypothetical protein [Lachnospiraceae bacterium]
MARIISCLTRVCFFYILDKLSIERILDKRENYLKTERDFYNGYSTELEGGKYLPKSTDFREVEKEKLELEFKMICDLRVKYCSSRE